MKDRLDIEAFLTDPAFKELQDKLYNPDWMMTARRQELLEALLVLRARYHVMLRIIVAIGEFYEQQNVVDEVKRGISEIEDLKAMVADTEEAETLIEDAIHEVSEGVRRRLKARK